MFFFCYNCSIIVWLLMLNKGEKKKKLCINLIYKRIVDRLQQKYIFVFHNFIFVLVGDLFTIFFCFIVHIKNEFRFHFNWLIIFFSSLIKTQRSHFFLFYRKLNLIKRYKLNIPELKIFLHIHIFGVYLLCSNGFFFYKFSKHCCNSLFHLR